MTKEEASKKIMTFYIKERSKLKYNDKDYNTNLKRLNKKEERLIEAMRFFWPEGE